MHLFLDTETTGTGELDAVIEIGAVDAEGEERMNTLVRPLAPMSREARSTHGIDEATLEKAPRFREVARALQHHVRRADTVWAYNAGFDRRLLIQTAEMAGASAAKKALRQAEWRDLMDRATDHLGEDAWVSLAEAAERLGAGPEEGALHRAKGDAALAWRVWKRMGAPAFSEGRERTGGNTQRHTENT